jgi:hypothetical protein
VPALQLELETFCVARIVARIDVEGVPDPVVETGKVGGSGTSRHASGECRLEGSAPTAPSRLCPRLRKS